MLLSEALEREKITGVVTLRQNGAIVGVENGPNLLSIYVDPGPNIPPGAQLGLPSLLEQGSVEQFTLLNEWIRVCDSTHDKCRRDNAGDILTMPTRLIEVGEPVRLVDSASIKTSPYVALSHCWGPLKDNEKFCTSKRNIEQLKSCIPLHSLPRTFRDTVTITRGLRIKYIWIDSLCIIQDDDDDWERESGKMERVFSDAYCTIGASSGRSSLEGFLADRTPRDYVQLQTQSAGALYVCPAIDDFHRHVELGELNRRGWVLQERALSRRSIYFTSTQVYWECGKGVQCETLARLYNSKAALLGDANFPNSALEYYRDGRQVLIQDLYERYSGLAFTKPSDRPVAILGLQERLARAFRTQAAYGCFAVYFARGILWTRRDDKRMTRIILPAGRRVPSWSWISKEGPIKYMELKFKEIDWATTVDFENPFTRELAAEPEQSSGLGVGGELGTLRGLARRIQMTKWEVLNYIIFDEEGPPDYEDLRCVVIGRDKVENGEDNPKHHALIILQVRSVLGVDIYERVGVASLKPEHVESGGAWVRIM